MKIGFIGGGKMAYALANGFISAGLTKGSEITASCHPLDKLSAEAFKKLGAETIFENKPVVRNSDIVIVSVKPTIVNEVLGEIKDLKENLNKLFISIAMGINLKTLENLLPGESRVVRVMPNTPALVQKGASVYSMGTNANEQDANVTEKLFNSVGTCDQVPEVYMNAVTALSGSGPAYVYMMIESLADGGVKAGLPRDLSIKLATQTVLGSASMVETGMHPAVLRDNVTSPAGSTAAGTFHLENHGFRAAVIGAVVAANERCIQVSSSN